MKKLLLASLILLASISFSSCRKLESITDSDISAIRDQTEVLKQHNELIKEQNAILTRIETKLK